MGANLITEETEFDRNSVCLSCPSPPPLRHPGARGFQHPGKPTRSESKASSLSAASVDRPLFKDENSKQGSLRCQAAS